MRLSTSNVCWIIYNTLLVMSGGHHRHRTSSGCYRVTEEAEVLSSSKYVMESKVFQPHSSLFS